MGREDIDEFPWELEGRSISVGWGNYVLVTLSGLSTWIQHFTKVSIDVFYLSTAPSRNFLTSLVPAKSSIDIYKILKILKSLSEDGSSVDILSMALSQLVSANVIFGE